MGRANGVTRDEIVEIVIQPAFYTGWPRARAVFAQVGEVWPGRPRGGRDDIGARRRAGVSPSGTGPTHATKPVQLAQWNRSNLRNEVDFSPNSSVLR